MSPWRVVIWGMLLMAAPRMGLGQTYEDIFEQFEDANLPELSDLLRDLVPKPIRINSISSDSIASLWFLQEDQMTALIDLHQKFAPHLTNEQIARAIHLPIETVEILFSDDRPVRPRRLSLRNRSRLKQAGLQQDLRFEIQYRGWHLGWLQEKDAGEKRLDDFLSGYVKYAPARQNFQWILGDFTVQVASGLVFAGPYGQPTLTLPRTVVAFHSPRVRRYRSVAENLAFRGIAAHLKLSRLDLLALFSRAKRDATPGPGNIIVSRPLSGYHRTAYERSARKRLQETVQGLSVSAEVLPQLQLGIILLQQRFDHEIQPPDSIRQHFSFRGQSNLIQGIHFFYRAKSGQFFGELARTAVDMAVLLGTRLQFSKMSLVAATWRAGPNFHNDYGVLPGENIGGVSNQTAFYLGLGHRNRLGKITLYLHRLRTPWRTFTYPMPIQRQELGLQWERHLGRHLFVLARYRIKQNPQLVGPPNDLAQRPGNIVLQSGQKLWRFQLRVKLARAAYYKVRFDGNALGRPGQKNASGVSQLHELSWTPQNNLTMGLRYAYFSTDGFESRIFQFEPIFPGLLQPVALFGEGERAFAFFRWRIKETLKIAIYANLQNKFSESHTSQFGLQIRLN